MSSTDRAGTLAAVAFSLAVHAAAGIWLATRPPMFRTKRPQAPIEVALVPARPLPPTPDPEPEGGGSPAEEPRPAPPRTDRMPRPSRPAAPARPRPRPPPEVALPRARAVEAGPAAAALSPEEAAEPAPAAIGEADLGIGAGGIDGVPGGRGDPGGEGGSGGAGEGGGSGAGSGAIVKPRELRRPSLAEMRALYPEQARREGLQAKVRLQLLVNAAGRVADVRVVRAAGHGFDEAATALARRFVFEPGRRDGRPTSMWITLTYSFEIEG